MASLVRALGAGALVLVLGGARPAVAATYAGTLAEPGVVWISDGWKPGAGREATMRNVDKHFVPDVLVVAAGDAVRFPNDDDFFHSIYGEAGADPFDIGFYDSGPGKVVTFATPGIESIRCHIHGSMHATVVVVDGPWAQTAGPNERYLLRAVRPGPHTLHVWTPARGESVALVRV